MFRITDDPSSGSLVQSLEKIRRMILSCPLTWTRSVLWQHIVTGCVCVQFTVYELYVKYKHTHAQPVTIRGLLEKYPTFGREKETGLLGALDT